MPTATFSPVRASILLLVGSSFIASCGPEVSTTTGTYYTPAGPLALRLDPNAVALKTEAPADLTRLLSRFPAANVKKLGPNAALWPQAAMENAVAEQLLDKSPDLSRLAVYRSDDLDAPLIADERMRAKFSPDLSIDQITVIAIRAGVVELGLVHPERNVYELISPAPEQTLAIAQRLHESPGVEWAHPDFFQRLILFDTPNDEYFDIQWHHARIRSADAWDMTRGSASVRVAVIDTGVEMTHSDLANKIVDPFDAHQNDQNPQADAYSPHGTSCAGLATAVTDNGTGVAGVCAECSLIPIRMASEADPQMRASAPADSFYWAADHDARVISNSWGLAPMPYDLVEAMDYTANDARSGAGVLILFASGNDGTRIPANDPSTNPNVMAIGASDPNDARFSYSNYGPELAVISPAGSVTTDLFGGNGYSTGDYTDVFGGTSAATPVAAGVAGLLFSQAPDLDRWQAGSVMIATAEQIGNRTYVAGRNDYYGHGRVDAAAALQMLVTGLGDSCAANTECGPAGTCLADAEQWFGDNVCALGCVTDSDCPGDLGCHSFAGGVGACLPSCTGSAQCGTDQSCWPTSSGDIGHCVSSCHSNADCGTTDCNEFGLCGTLTPPDYVPPGPPPTDPPTDPSDPEGTITDPTDVMISGYSSCRAAPSRLAWLGGLVWLLGQRWRRRR